MSLFSVNAILILSIDDGSRIFAKYYTAPHQSSTTGQKDGKFMVPVALRREVAFCVNWL
jgi:hypothetical protein